MRELFQRNTGYLIGEFASKATYCSEGCLSSVTIEQVALLFKSGSYAETISLARNRGKSVLQYAEQQAERDSPKAKEILELIRQAPKVDRGWQKSRDTKAMEDIWQMIENPEKFKGKPAP